MRVLVTGWFSFQRGEATAGDLLAMRVATGWLTDAGIRHDVACSPILGCGVDLANVDPADYSDVVFVCGPAQGQQLHGLRSRFQDCRLTFLDVSMTAGADATADSLFERDSERVARPDLAIAAQGPPAPFVPVVRGHAQPEYGERDGHAEATEIIDRLLARRPLATVELDTRVDPRVMRAREPSQIEGVLARADAVVTSRLHGLVLALRHDVPALAIDPVHGGGKVSAQAGALGWPEILTLEEAVPHAVDAALTRCLQPPARRRAAACREQAVESVEALGQAFVDSLAGRPRAADRGC